MTVDENAKKAGCLLLICAIVALIPLGWGLIALGGGAMPTYSEGERTGELVKISKKGLLWSSWEGQLILNQFAIGREGSNLFEFSCRDDSVGKEIEKHIGKRVVVRYRQYLIRPLQQSTDYTVLEIKEIREVK